MRHTDKRAIDVMDDVLGLIFEELRKAEEKFPSWPQDVVHGSAIISEEAGEITQAALDYYYGRSESLENLKKETAQTAAMAIRLLLNIASGENNE